MANDRSRTTPIPVIRAVPKRVRQSLPPRPSLEDVTRALADECRAYDDAMDRTNEVFTSLVKEARERAVPAWVRLGAVAGMIALGVSVGLTVWHLCALFGGPCRG